MYSENLNGRLMHVMEFCNKGTLSRLIHRAARSKFPDKMRSLELARELFCGIVSGLKFIHSAKISTQRSETCKHPIE
jgi:serine/threonine protein kinase